MSNPSADRRVVPNIEVGALVSPAAGTWKAGDVVLSSLPTSGVVGWVCVLGGTPGTWKVIGTAATPEIVSVAANTTLTASQSGAICVNTKTSSTTTFTLPAAAAGLNFTFVEGGDAGGELKITPATGDAIVGKVSADVDALGLAPAAGTGIKNTAASNVKGDFVRLVAVDDTTWHMVAIAGVWASQ